VLEQVTRQSMLYQPLSYLIRTGLPDGWDAVAAVNFALGSVRLVREGQFGHMVAFRGKEGYIDLPLDSVNADPSEMPNMKDYYDASEYMHKSVFYEILWI
jgi:6-phosphofructokinase 1